MLGSPAVRPSHVAVSVSRLGVLLALSLCFLLGSYGRLTHVWPSFGVLLYSAHLAALAGALQFAVWAVLFQVEINVPRGRLLSTLLALGSLGPAMYFVANHVAAGDGLRARGVPELVTMSVAFGVLATLAAIVWSYRFWARWRVFDLLFALVAISGLLLADAQLSRAQTELSTLLELFALFLAAQLVLIVIGPNPNAQWVIGLLGCAACLALSALGLFLPERVAHGRRLMLVGELSSAYVATRWLGPAPQKLAPRVDPERCRELRDAPPFPALALPAEQRRNVILISIDTLRADHVQLQVGGKPLMPGLSAFAREARYAPRAQSGFPATMLSMTSAFTGFLPSDLLLAPKPIENVFTRAKGTLTTIEAVLPRGRYFTRPDVQAYLLSGAELSAVGSAPRQTDYAIRKLRLLRSLGERHMMWIHFYEPHEPYKAREPYDFGPRPIDRYRSELAMVDEQLSQLLEVLRTEGWYDDSLIMIFADHGESFGEHNHFHHHYLVYPWLVNVPLLWRAPDTEPARVDAPVHLMDVAASVLHFLDLSPPGALRGRSLLARLPEPSRVLFSEELSVSGRVMQGFRSAPARDEAELLARFDRIERGPGYASKLAVRRLDRYFVQQRASGAEELYAWRSDPLAAHDLVDAEPETAEALNHEAERLRANVYERAACELLSFERVHE